MPFTQARFGWFLFAQFVEQFDAALNLHSHARYIHINRADLKSISNPTGVTTQTETLPEMHVILSERAASRERSE